MRINLIALALLLALLAPLPVYAQGGGFGLGPAHGNGGGGGSFSGDLDGSDLTDSSDGTVGVDGDLVVAGSLTADSLTLENGESINNATDNTLDFRLGGATRIRMNSGNALQLGTVPLSFGISAIAAQDLYLRRSAASTLTVDADGAGGAATLAVSNLSDGSTVRYDLVNGRVRPGIGNDAAPAVASSSDTNTGLVWDTEDAIGISTGGTRALTLDASQNATFAGDVVLPAGSGASPSVRGPDTNSGIYWTGAGQNTIVAVNGSATLSVTTSGVSFGDVAYLDSYTVATLPSAATAGGLIYVSDETGGAVLAFSDGTNWRRVTDRAVVS